MNVRGTILFSLLLIAQMGFAQKLTRQKTFDPQDYLYKKEASGGLRLHTNGITIYGEYGWIKDIFKTRLLQIEYQYFINYSQKRQNAQRQSGRDFVYGLQNRFHAIRFNYGIKRQIADKANRNGVRLCYVAYGGISLGLVKPYYLNLIQPGDGGAIVVKPERYSSDNKQRFLALDSIADAAPIRYGLSEIDPVPGLHGKFGLNFDWGRKDEYVKALECGIMLDLYYKRIPMMVNNNNRLYQASLYLSFHFGKRW